MKAILCHNPTAGKGKHKKKELLAAFELADIDVRYCSIDSDEFPDALAEPTDVIVAAGGDGTVAKVIKNMPDRSVPLAILPLGTANNIARSFGIAGKPHELSESWRLDRWCPLDVGLARGSWREAFFVEGVGLGALVKAMKKAPEKLPGAENLMAGRRALQKTLRKAEPIDATVIVDGVPLKDSGMLAIEIVNVAYIGPGLPAPQAIDPGDGTLGVVVVYREHRDDMLAWLTAPHKGQMPAYTLSARKVEFACRGASLRLDDDVDVPDDLQSGTAEIDGSPVKVLVAPPTRQRALREAESGRGRL